MASAATLRSPLPDAAPATGHVLERLRVDPAFQAFALLRIGFAAAPVLFGLDKFFNLMVGVPRVTMHAFRRSMVKFCSDAGVDQAAIMQFTGHRTDSMFRRYRIVDTTSQVLAAKKVARWADELAAETPTRGARTKH
jgi:integrase